METYFKYSIIQFAPGGVRGERLNVGVAVYNSVGIEIKLTDKMEKIKAISVAVDVAEVRALSEEFTKIARRFVSENSDSVPHEAIRDMLNNLGLFWLAEFGEFLAENPDVYERRLRSIMASLVDPEPAPKALRVKRSRLFTQIKAELRRARVLAAKEDTIDDHRVIPSFELAEGIVADLLLKNGRYHVTEIVDIEKESDNLRKVISDISVSALTFESARMLYGKENTQSRLVYFAPPSVKRQARTALESAKNQGCVLIDWSDLESRIKFTNELVSLAVPSSAKNRSRIRRPSYDT